MKVHVIPGGVEVDKFQPMDTAKAQSSLDGPKAIPSSFVCVVCLSNGLRISSPPSTRSPSSIRRPNS